MAYIGPVNTWSHTAKTKTVKGYSPEQNMKVSKPVESTVSVAPLVDRRQSPDRRQGQRDNLVETRTGGDRRKSNRPKIDIII